MSLEILGRKVKMGNIFRNDGDRVPVTFIELIPLTVTQVKRKDGKDRYSAIQVGYERVPGHKLTRAEIGHQKNLEGQPFRRLTEMRVEDPSSYEVGQVIGWDHVKVGDHVNVIGVSKGRGFAGVIKRHHFSGQSASHGTSMVHRKPMSSGATDAARVFRGVRKPGRMGAERVTVRNLEVIMIDGEKGIMAIKGAVPGPSGGMIRIVPTGK